MGADTRERSGTPVETRGGTRRAARSLGTAFEGRIPGTTGDVDQVISNIGDPLSRLGAEARTDVFGFDPRLLTRDVAEQLLASPEDATAELFSTMVPFENRERERAAAEVRESFGTAGGRFSRNLLDAESEVRGELSDRFRRARAEELLRARQTQTEGLRTILNAALQGEQMQRQGTQQMLAQLLGFFQPGAPVIERDQGIFPGLLGAGATLGGLALMGPGGGAASNEGADRLLGAAPGIGASAGLG